MQSSGGGGAGAASQYGGGGGGDMNPPPPPPAVDAVFGVDQAVVEAASPISSRPPAGNLDDYEALGVGDEADRAGGSGGGGNRWPRQETLALLRIRSEMDVTFRDATLKGPLWEDVSRKLGELGFKRSAKKCKEKFENVHKYYKRTKEGRAGRQDGKSYRFFSELEALHASTNTNTTIATTTTTSVSASASPAPPGFPSPPPPINPTPISSIRFGNTKNVTSTAQVPYPIPGMFGQNANANAGGSVSVSAAPQAVAQPIDHQGGAASFSTNTASTSEKSEEDEEGDHYNLSSRKRKRGGGDQGGSGSSTTKKMMEFFEGLMKQVMQKQEAMQQRFLEAVEKREQDRMIREEAWKRQEMARLGREHELLAQERAVSASRDAAIINFLQKITGQTVQLPPHLNIPPQPPPPQQPPPQPQPQPQQQRQQQQNRPQPPPPAPAPQQKQPAPASTDIVMAVPEQQVAPLPLPLPLPPQQQQQEMIGGFEGASPSRWPKTEVLALINLRSGLESRYQEAGPKGPLWEEISSGMKRLGYNRNSKRCKEKWENINKYFKKVKESNKKRPEDAKTCPYFHQLDALYRKKILTTTSGNSNNNNNLNPLLDHPIPATAPNTNVITPQDQNKNGGPGVDHDQAMAAANLFGEPAKKPEDIVKEMMAQQQQQQQRQQLMVDDYDKIEDGESDDIEDEEDDEEVEEEEEEEERKMDYKIEFQRQNTTTAPSNGGGNGAPSFLSMVQ